MERSGVILMWSVRNQTWVDARHDIHDVSRLGNPPSNRTGIDIPFASAILGLNISTNVGFVPMATPGTSMFQSWRPSTNDKYPDMILQTRAAMVAATNSARLRGIIIILGEADALSVYNSLDPFYNPTGQQWGAGFSSYLTEFILGAQADLSQYNSLLPVIVAVQTTRDRDKAYPWMQSIRDQTWAIRAPNLIKADMDGCSMYKTDLSGWNGFMGMGPWIGNQSIHLTRSGQCCMGQRMAYAYQAAMLTLTNQTWYQ